MSVEQLLGGHEAGFGIRGCLDDDHDAHVGSPSLCGRPLWRPVTATTSEPLAVSTRMTRAATIRQCSTCCSSTSTRRCWRPRRPGHFETEMRQCLQHADEMAQEGTAAGLRSSWKTPGTAKTVRVRGGKTSVLDGPFAETKEVLAGLQPGRGGVLGGRGAHGAGVPVDAVRLHRGAAGP